MTKTIVTTFQVSTPVIKYKPSIKTKILGILIPFVMMVGTAMIVLDRLDVGSARSQNSWKAGALLLVYCIYSLRGLFNYRIFLTLTPEEIDWVQGFGPFKKSLTFKYNEIQSLEITTLTSTLVFRLSSGTQLKLSPSIVRFEGEIANKATGAANEPGTNYPAVREIFFLKNEIQRRI